MLRLILAHNALLNATLFAPPKPVLAEDEAARVFGGLGSSISAAGQVRAMKRMSAAEQQAEMQDHLEHLRYQKLAYDAERWPHCMDLPVQTR